MGLKANAFSFSAASIKLSDFKYFKFTWNRSIMDKIPNATNNTVWLITFLMAKNTSVKIKST